MRAAWLPVLAGVGPQFPHPQGIIIDPWLPGSGEAMELEGVLRTVKDCAVDIVPALSQLVGLAAVCQGA